MTRLRWHCRVMAREPMGRPRPLATIEADTRSGVVDLLYATLLDRVAQPAGAENYTIDIWSALDD